MDNIFDQLETSTEDLIPRLIGALLILVVGWLVAWLVANLIQRLLHRTTLDERVARWLGMDRRTDTESAVASIAFWVIILLAVIGALEALALETVTDPLNEAVSDIFGFLPNLLAAAIILVIGWLIASVLRRVVSNLAASVGVDGVATRAGLDDPTVPRISDTIGLVVFALVIIPTIVAGLNALELEAVAGPTSELLDKILLVLPDLFAAAVLMVIAYIVARIVGTLVTGVLAGAGVNTLPQRLGAAAGQTVGGRSLSQIAGYLVVVTILLFAAMEALRIVGFIIAADLIAELLVFMGQIAAGLVVIAVGLWLANVAAEAIRASGTTQAGLLALIARVAVIVLAAAIGLREMGLANEIIILAFALPLAAVAVGLAVAVGVAFGLGGREVAARELENARQQVRSNTGGGTTPPGSA